MPVWPLVKERTRSYLAVTFSSLLVVTVLAIAALPPSSHATPEVSPTAQGKHKRAEFVPGEVLVRYKTENVAKRQSASITLESVDGRPMPIQVERFEGSEIVSGLRIARVAPEDTLSAIEALKNQPDILYAEPNYILHSDVTPNDPSFSQLYGLTKIGAPQAWDTQKGSTGIVVGVIDEGIDINHPDLQSNIWTNPAPGSISGITGDLHGYDFANNTGNVFSGNASEDHATHVAGTIGAVGNNGQGVVGVNWNVGLMSLKFLSGSSGSTSNAIRACNYARQMRDLWVSSGGSQGANVRVLNNSYGGGGFSQSFLNAINALNQSGILFVAAAGNIDTDTPEPNNELVPHYPSSFNAPNVVAVAATTQTDGLASFSHFGSSSVHLGAPGVLILSTTPNNTYQSFSGTSVATPHVSGAAALLLAQNPNLTVQQLKNLLLLNGDVVSALVDNTVSGRRLNVFNSLQALAENDTTPPGSVDNLHINTQNGRSLNVGWTASGDDGASGQASLYQVTFADSATGVAIPLKSVIPASSGSVQTVDVKLPYRHHVGTINIRELDNVGNEGAAAVLPVSVSFAEGDPYAPTLGAAAELSTGGTLLPELNFDDRYRENYPLPFAFPFYGQNYSSVTISTNGNLYFSAPPKRSNGDADDVPGSSIDLAKFKMIAGLWDDLDLRTSSRANAGVYVVQPDANRIIFRWQGVPCNDNGSVCTGGAAVNFEIELRSNGTIETRYGSGNTNLFPVVGISGGEPEAYVISTHTSENTAVSLTNAQKVTFLSRTVINPLDNADFFVSQQYRDFLSRESDSGGLAFWSDQITSCPAGDQLCINARRIRTADAFFFEPEFQQTGSYVIRLYRAAYGNNQPFPNPDFDPRYPGLNLTFLSYAKFNQDHTQVVGGFGLSQSQLDLANAFVQRQEFLNKYPAGLSPQEFITAVLATIQGADAGVDLTSQQTALTTLYNQGGRGAVMYRLADDNVQTNPVDNRAFIDAEYNRTFVEVEYFGFLRRDGDTNGLNFWLGQINRSPVRDTEKQHAMVCSFITSTEYQRRFSEIVTHSNQECPQ